MKFPRRQFLQLAAGAALLPAVSSIAKAQGYPARPIRLIIGYTPGGSADLTARLMGQWLSERLGQSFVIENRPGGGTNIATEAAVRADPDGYTFLLVAPANAINATLYSKLNFNFLRDIEPVAGIIRFPNVVVVNPSLPIKSISELIAYAKANPGKLSFSSPGVGSASHLAGEMLKTMAGIDMVHVPNKGMSPAVLDVIGGQVQVVFASVPSIVKQKPEHLRPIAMAEMKRSALLPDLPTINESGLPGFAVANWAGLLGPAGLDPKIVKKLHDEIIAIIATAEMKERIKTLGYDLIESSPEQFATDLRADIERWGPVAKRAGVSVK